MRYRDCHLDLRLPIAAGCLALVLAVGCGGEDRPVEGDDLDDEAPRLCGDRGHDCEDPDVDCCNGLVCDDGVCVDAPGPPDHQDCRAVGDSCDTDRGCCSGECVDGTCREADGACLPLLEMMQRFVHERIL